MSLREKLSNPNLSEEEAGEIIGTFMQRYEREQLRKHYTEQLRSNYGIRRSDNTIIPKRTVRKRPPWGIIISIAASLLLVVVALVFWNKLTLASGNVLLATYLDPAQVTVPVYRSTTRPDALPAQQREALLASFRAGNYQKAVENGEALPKPTATDQFYLGLAYLGLDDYSAAQSIFQELSNEQQYAVEADWYATLVLFKLDQSEQAIKVLQDYQPEDAYYDQAQRLLRARW
ncbi:MAG: hypothetical protein AAF828_02290 [Bacteroidota bacterium]